MAVQELIGRLAKDHWLTEKEYEMLLTCRFPEVSRQLRVLADRERRRFCGTRVFLRGVVEVSSICENDCLLCPRRKSSDHCERYRLRPREILDLCDESWVQELDVTEDDLDSIADKLKATGLIQYRSLFKLYGQISDAMDSIRTGTFQLNTKFDYHALVDAMSSNQRRVTINVTIPEGYTVQQTFALLEHYGVSTVDALEEAAANGELGEYWFLEGIDRSVDNCLEGYLFPDTYTFYLDHNPVGVLQKFLDNFNKRFNDVMKLKLDTLNVTLSDMMRANGLPEDYIAQHQMTLRDVVIIASMIEKETASNPESYTISSVIYNRLTNPNGETAGYLQLDATLVYINGGKTPSNADKLIDSPYNTYLYKGLPAGPISNPGSYSLDAALDPAQTAYYFYALDPSTGEHHFSKTLKEHEAFLESIRNAETKEDPEE